MVSTVSTLWYVDADDPAAVLREHREPDQGAAQALAKQLFEDHEITPKTTGTLAGCAGPADDEIYIGCYPGLTVVCTRQVRLPDPTTLPEPLIRPLACEHTYLVSFDASMGWGSFAHWERGEFRRGFSSSRMKILADAGLPMVWERPFWAGERPVLWRANEIPDPQCLPYDPLDFADEANGEWLGFQYRAPVVAGALLPRDIAVCGFTLSPEDPPRKPREPAPDPRTADDRPRDPAPVHDQHSRAPGRSRGLRALEAGRRGQGTEDRPEDQAFEPHDPAPGPRARVREPRARSAGPREQTIGPRGQVPAAVRQARSTRAAVPGPQARATGERKAIPGERESLAVTKQRAFGQRGPVAARQGQPSDVDGREPEPEPRAAAPQARQRRGLLGWLRDASRTT